MTGRELVAASGASLVGGTADLSSKLAEAAEKGEPAEGVAAREKAIGDFSSALDRNVGRLDEKLIDNGKRQDQLLQLMTKFQDDPEMLRRLRKLFDQVMDQLRFEEGELRHERDKSDKLKRLMMALMMGFVPTDLVNDLKAMGMGAMVDKLITELLPKNNLRASAVKGLEAIGLAAMAEGSKQSLHEQDMISHVGTRQEFLQGQREGSLRKQRDGDKDAKNHTGASGSAGAGASTTLVRGIG